MFLVPKLKIFNIARNLAFLQIWGGWFQRWQYFFKHTAQNIQIRQFWCLIWFFFSTFFFFLFAFQKIIGYWFQISHSVFPIFSLKIPKRTFSISNLRIFIFARNFSKLATQNYTNKVFLVSELKLFVFHDLPFHKFQAAHSKHKNFLKEFSLKISRKGRFLSKI